MLAPLYQFGNLADIGLIIVAMFVGFTFGYIVENVGFSNAKNFTAAFYGNDWRVYKLIFSTIITTMTLIYFSYYLGFLDISLIPIPSLRLTPTITGGAIVGAGLVIGGYCPGTSIVASVTRKMDAWVYIGGYFLGIVVYAEYYDQFARFIRSENLGKMTLGDLFGLSYGLIAFLVILCAIATFFILAQVEGKLYQTSESGSK